MMKCHYEDCQAEALSTWPISRSEVPLCKEHAHWMTDAVPLPDVKAGDLIVEHNKLAMNIAAAMDHIRNDEEWDARNYR